MNCSRQAHWFLVFCVAGQLAVASAFAENATNIPPKKMSSVPANIMPPFPTGYSPVDFFRKLLAMSPGERETYLTNRAPAIRKQILKKVREYLALDPNERELRLRATELRWYLLPLLRESPTNRDARLEAIPQDLRGLVNSRLKQWDDLPATFQQEFLDNERTLRYFARVDATNNFYGSLPQSSGDQARWNALSKNERQKMTDQFNQFFELTPVEKQKTLNTLSEPEREQMEKTLKTFSSLPPAQRFECIRAFTEFAKMSPQDRAEFLKNAQRWAQLSPKERKAWRDLVAQVPIWPPLPPALIMPPLPPKILPRVHALMVTNAN